SMRRSATGRRLGSSRSWTLRNPLGSATGHLHDPAPHDVAVGVETLVDRRLARRKYSSVVTRKHLGELGRNLIEVLEHLSRHGRLGLVDVPLQQVTEDLDISAAEWKQLELARGQ